MHLALANGHVFCQWIGSDGTHVNLEGSNAGGGEMLPDEYYMHWPNEISTNQLASGYYLRPLSRPEELALFLQIRGHYFEYAERYAEARDAYTAAFRLNHFEQQYRAYMMRLDNRQSAKSTRDRMTQASP